MPSPQEVDQARHGLIGIGCAALGIVITAVASARLHASWSLGAAAIPFAVLYVATLVLTLGNWAIKPIALYFGYLALGCCMALLMVDRRHLLVYVVGLAMFVVLLGVGATIEQLKSRR
jgi:hypothetical protein